MFSIKLRVMSRLVVLQAADLHLDAPFEGVGRTPAHVAAALRDASLGAWDAIVDLALARAVDAVLLAGGLCDGLERGVRAQARLRDGLQRLGAAGIAVYIALGERDPLDGFAAIPAWPPGVTVFPSAAPIAVPLLRGGERLATVHGVSAARRPRAESAALDITRDDTPGLHLAVLHTRLAGHVSDTAGDAPRRLADLRTAGIDYWAIGCSPALDYLSTGAPWIVDPGTPQGRGLAASQCGPKGVVLAEFADGAVTRVDFEPVDRVRSLRVELAEVAEPRALVSLLSARAEALRERHPGRGLVLDAHVAGAPTVGRALRQPAAHAELLRALRRGAETWEPFVWWAAVRAAVPAQRAPAAGDDLAAEVERRRAVLADDAEHCARFLARRFEPLRDAWTADVDAREAGALLDEAAAVAVDALREDGG
jgi:hypothetical protein